jgi:hypothetical protein
VLSLNGSQQEAIAEVNYAVRLCQEFLLNLLMYRLNTVFTLSKHSEFYESMKKGKEGRNEKDSNGKRRTRSGVDGFISCFWW